MKKSTLIVLVILGFFVSGTASKPVTLTDFHNVYNYLDEVQHVIEHGLLDGKVVAFLVDENNPIDQKAAIINALVVNNKTQSNALTFRQYVARKYKSNWETFDLNNLTGDELFCLGYLTILDEQGNSTNGLPILELAVQKNPGSYTISLFYALAMAENSIRQGNACEGWRTCNNVKTNTTLNNDLNAGISDLIFNVMESYNDGCE